MEEEEEENIHHVKPRNKSKAQDSLQQTGIKIKRIIINLYIWLLAGFVIENEKVNIECNDWNG